MEEKILETIGVGLTKTLIDESKLLFNEISGNTQVRMNLGFKVGVRFF